MAAPQPGQPVCIRTDGTATLAAAAPRSKGPTTRRRCDDSDDACLQPLGQANRPRLCGGSLVAGAKERRTRHAAEERADTALRRPASMPGARIRRQHTEATGVSHVDLLLVIRFHLINSPSPSAMSSGDEKEAALQAMAFLRSMCGLLSPYLPEADTEKVCPALGLDISLNARRPACGRVQTLDVPQHHLRFATRRPPAAGHRPTFFTAAALWCGGVQRLPLRLFRDARLATRDGGAEACRSPYSSQPRNRPTNARPRASFLAGCCCWRREARCLKHRPTGQCRTHTSRLSSTRTPLVSGCLTATAVRLGGRCLQPAFTRFSVSTRALSLYSDHVPGCVLALPSIWLVAGAGKEVSQFVTNHLPKAITSSAAYASGRCVRAVCATRSHHDCSCLLLGDPCHLHHARCFAAPGLR